METNFDKLFTGQTFRFDYYHNGNAKEEQIGLDEIRLESAWPGSRTHLIDDTNLGKYFFEVVDVKTNQVIYSQGFAGVYGDRHFAIRSAVRHWATWAAVSLASRVSFTASPRLPLYFRGHEVRHRSHFNLEHIFKFWVLRVTKHLKHLIHFLLTAKANFKANNFNNIF